MRPRLLHIDRDLDTVSNALSFIALLCGGVIFFSGIAAIFFGVSTAPSHGQYSFLTEQGSAGSAPAMWTQYEHHRLVIPGLLIFLDQVLAGGRNGFAMAVTIASQIFLALMVVRLVSAEQTERPATGRLVAAAVAACIFYAGHIEIFAIPYRSWGALTIVFAVLSCVALFRATHRPDAQGFFAYMAGTIAFGVGATFSGAPGVLVWPTLLVMALALRARPGTYGLVLLAAAVVLAVYFTGFRAGVTGPGGAALLRTPERVVFSYAYYFGVPLVRPLLAADSHILNTVVPALVGAVGLIASTAIVVRRLFVRAVSSQLDAVTLSLIVFSFGWASAIVLKHTQAPPAAWGLHLSPAYMLSVLWFWLATVTEILRWDAARGTSRHVRRVILGLGTLLLFSLVPSHLYFADRAMDAKRIVDFSALAVAHGIPDDTMQAQHPAGQPASIAWAPTALPYLRTHALPPYDFALLHHLGADAGVLGAAPTQSCRGTVDEMTPLPSEGGARLLGRFDDPNTDYGIAAVDADNIIVGVGRTWRAPALLRWLGRAPAGHTPWHAYATAAGGAPLAVYGIAEDGVAVCVF